MADTQHDMTAFELPSPCAAYHRKVNKRCLLDKQLWAKLLDATLTTQGVQRGRDPHQEVPAYVEPLHETRLVLKSSLKTRIVHIQREITVFPMAAAAKGLAP